MAIVPDTIINEICSWLNFNDISNFPENYIKIFFQTTEIIINNQNELNQILNCIKIYNINTINNLTINYILDRDTVNTIASNKFSGTNIKLSVYKSSLMDILKIIKNYKCIELDLHANGVLLSIIYNLIMDVVNKIKINIYGKYIIIYEKDLLHLYGTIPQWMNSTFITIPQELLCEYFKQHQFLNLQDNYILTDKCLTIYK